MSIGLPIKTFLENIRKNIYIHAGVNNEKLFDTKKEVYRGFGRWRGKKKWCNHIIIFKKKYSFKKRQNTSLTQEFHDRNSPEKYIK